MHFAPSALVVQRPLLISFEHLQSQQGAQAIAQRDPHPHRMGPQATHRGDVLL